MFIYTNHQMRKADRKVNEMAHIRVPICWQAGGQVRELVHIGDQSWLAVKLSSKLRLRRTLQLTPQSLLHLVQWQIPGSCSNFAHGRTRLHIL